MCDSLIAAVACLKVKPLTIVYCTSSSPSYEQKHTHETIIDKDNHRMKAKTVLNYLRREVFTSASAWPALRLAPGT